MIAYDNSTNGGQTGSTPSSKTYAHTTGSISDGVLYVSVHTQGTNGTTASQPTVTYNGTSMTFEEGSSTIGTSGKTWIYSLANPSSGSNNIVITAGATKAEYIASEAASYSGVDSANLYVDENSAGVNSTQITTTLTPSGNGYWFAVTGFSQRNMSVNSGTYEKRQPSTTLARIYGDSNGTISGSTSAVTDISDGGNVTHQIMWTFAPAGGGATFKPIVSMF